MLSLKKFSWCFVFAMAAYAGSSGCKAEKSEDDAEDGGEGGDSGDGGDGGSTDPDGEGGNGGRGGEGTKGGTGGGGQGGLPNQGGGVVLTRPNVTNKAACQPPALKLTKVGSAAAPMQITQAKGDDFILVAERSGKIQRLKDGKLDGVFANFEPSVEVAGDDTTSERGLLGLALHPDYDNNGRFFVFYNRRAADPHSTGTRGGVVIAEGKRSSADKTKADAKLTPLAVAPAGGDHHIGGFLAFGRDGYLYAALGDNGGRDDGPEARGLRPRDFKDLRGKVLRIDVDSPMRKVEGNLDKPDAAPQVWVYGVRNPFRGSFDSATGDLYIGDVGEFAYEEVNYVEFAKQPDPDFGWYLNMTEKAEGPACGSSGAGLHQAQTGMEGDSAAVPFYVRMPWKTFGHLPIKSIPHTGGGSSYDECSWMGKGLLCSGGSNAACSRAIIGGVVYRGKKIPDLDGRYIYGEHVHNTVDSFVVKDGAVSCEASLTETFKSAGTPLQGITSFGTDKDGEVYITDLAGGNIYRIDLK